MKKIFLFILLVSICFTFVGVSAAADTEKIVGIVKDTGVIFGIGEFVTLVKAPDKEFVMSEKQATRVGAMTRKHGSVYYSPLKGQHVIIIYEKTEKKRYGRNYFQVISIKKTK